MKTALVVPETIRVGFQKRDDTYSKKLAYVTWYDNKGVLRKEKSFEDWRDHKIPAEEYENKPMSGFVINKNAGGVENSWGRNARRTYIRVYDPRGFEVEISVPNLLYILDCGSCTSKVLDGSFVYAWDGTELVLLPISAPEYVEIQDYNEKLKADSFIKPKDFQIGYVYRDKKNNRMVYLGKFDYVTTHSYEPDEVELIHQFVDIDNFESLATTGDAIHGAPISTYKSLSKRFIAVENTPVDPVKMRSFMDYYRGTPEQSSFDKVRNQSEKLSLTKSQFANLLALDDYLFINGDKAAIRRVIKSDEVGYYKIITHGEYKNDRSTGWRQKYVEYFAMNVDGTELFTADEVFDYIQPYVRPVYLMNGRLFRYEIGGRLFGRRKFATL